jgi:hypothetical protein
VSHRVNGPLKTRVLQGGDRQGLHHIAIIDTRHSRMQGCKRAFEVIHDLSLGSYRLGPGLGLLIRGGFVGEDVGRHTVVVGGQVFYLLGESTGAGKLTRGWRERISLFRHGIGGRGNFFLGVGYPEVERLADREPGLSQRKVTDCGEKQAQQNARDNLHDSSLKTKFSTMRQTHEHNDLCSMRRVEGFQKLGGPRSVSGDPIDDTMMAESKDGKAFSARGSGLGTSNLCSSVN